MRCTSTIFLFLLVLSGPARADVLISEVYYDHVGSDDGFEWIELVNTGPNAVDLTGYTIGAGGTDYTYSVTPLSGTIGACETFVIGVNSVPENQSPQIDLVLDFAPDLQNGGTTADGVALFGPGADPALDCPLDTLLYGFDNTSGLIDESCAVQAPDLGPVPAGASIQRTSLAGNWLATGVPQPNQFFLMDFDCSTVDTDEGSFGVLKARFGE